MCRSTRRFHAARVKAKFQRIAFEHSPRWYFGIWPYDGPAAWWKHGISYYPYARTPSAWTHTMMTVPHRAKTRMLIRRIEKGEDSEGFNWPLARKPHIYYW